MGKGGEESRKILWKRNGGKGEEHNRKGREDMILYFCKGADTRLCLFTNQTKTQRSIANVIPLCKILDTRL